MSLSSKLSAKLKKSQQDTINLQMQQSKQPKSFLTFSKFAYQHQRELETEASASNSRDFKNLKRSSDKSAAATDVSLTKTAKFHDEHSSSTNENASLHLNEGETETNCKTIVENQEEIDISADAKQSTDSVDQNAHGIKYQTSLGKTYTLDMTEEEIEEIRKLHEQSKSDKPPTVAAFKVFTNETLEALLRYNDRPNYSLPKPQLAAMVQDHVVKGVPPRCPKCHKGALRFSNGKKKYGKRYYWCPGFTPNGKNFYGCNFKADRKEIMRIPWKCP